MVFIKRYHILSPPSRSDPLSPKAHESPSSATEMLCNDAAILDAGHRNAALGIAQVVMLGELVVNQAFGMLK